MFVICRYLALIKVLLYCRRSGYDTGSFWVVDWSWYVWHTPLLLDELCTATTNQVWLRKLLNFLALATRLRLVITVCRGLDESGNYWLILKVCVVNSAAVPRGKPGWLTELWTHPSAKRGNAWVDTRSKGHVIPHNMCVFSSRIFYFGCWPSNCIGISTKSAVGFLKTFRPRRWAIWWERKLWQSSQSECRKTSALNAGTAGPCVSLCACFQRPSWKLTPTSNRLLK